MRHTLKAVFNDRDTAQQALDTLLASGYPSADTALITVLGDRRSSGAEGHAVPRRRERGGTSATRFLERFFSRQKSDPVRAAPNRCPPDSHVLILATESEPEAGRAALLVSGFMRSDSKGGGGGVPEIGPTLFQPLPPADDDNAREAFRFGHDIHANDRYRNRSWSEAAADLNVLWKAGDPERAEWESSESAIRSGWNSTHPEIDDDSYHREHWKTSYSRSPEEEHARAGNGRVAGTTDTEPNAAWKQRHPGDLPAWENFMDALRYGWGRIVIATDMDESDYRTHHAGHYPGTNYDDLAPVYRYGNNVRRRTAFHDRSWDEVESALRVEWERGYREGKPSTWDEIKAAFYRGRTGAGS
jgi:hypothetical protein